MRWSEVLFLTLWSLISAGEIHSKEITLFSHFIDSSPSVTGERILLKQNFTPASTFKYWISLFLIEKNLLSPNFQKISSEKHIPRSPRALDLREAMLYSSNSFFLSFFEEDPNLYEELQDFLIRIGFVTDVYKNPFLNRKNIYLSPAIEKSPESQHNFLVSFLKDEGRSRGVSPKTFQFWKESAYWSDCDSQNSKVYGKTGSLGGAFWFLGFLEKRQSFWENQIRKLPKSYSVGTVLQTGDGASREGAIRSFYRNAGCENEIEKVLKRISE